jgi:LmbE family N-acetylglucosaminyl deacetylase
MEASMSTGMSLANRLKLWRTNAGRLVQRVRASVRGNRTASAPDQWRPAGGRVLVIAPHPDDEVIGCGGTVVRHVRAGDPVTVVLLTRGGKSVGYPWLSEAERREVREQESRASARLMGVEEIIFIDGEEGSMTAPAVKERVVGQLAGILASRKPMLVYVPHPHDGHPDHTAAYELLRDLMGSMNGSRPRVMQYEVWTPLNANCAVDISEVMDVKLRAIKCHRLALDAFNYVTTLTGLARYRSGSMLGVQGFAEAFHREDEAGASALVQEPRA